MRPQPCKAPVKRLSLYPLDRVMHPVMNSIRKDIEVIAAPGRGGATQARALKPLPINVRPYDNEYAWKGNRVSA